MKNQNLKITTCLNWAALIVLILILILSLSEKIRFGYGLGDLFYTILMSALIPLHLIMILIVQNNAGEKLKHILLLVLGMIFITIDLYLIWSFSLGRGSEYRWNGYIFN